MSGVITNQLRKFYHFVFILVSMAGFVPKNITVIRILAMIASLVFAAYLSIYQPGNFHLATFYFLLSEIFYLSFINSVLLKNGLRHWFIRVNGNEQKGFTRYETILGFLFFHNGVSIGYIASTSQGTLFPNVHSNFLLIIVAFVFITGMSVKIFATKAVSVEIYYWKDMFLGRKVTDFVVTGPYKYFSNPMYGIGQLPTYATAIWYGSEYGLVAAFLNQVLIFTFFYTVEKKFIKRVYGSV